jgi:ABC-type uncharacterized transport system substrate-binding protein
MGCVKQAHPFQSVGFNLYDAQVLGPLGDGMRRREFIRLLAGAVALPLAAKAQQADRVRRIGVLMGIRAFLQGLQEHGWAVGRNMRIDIRWTAGKASDIRKYAGELVALAPDVILASGGTVVGSLLQATNTVPVVFTLTPDPVGAGFVDSLAKPGGNATGFTNIEYGESGKWPELLKQIAPSVTRAAVLRDPVIAQGIGVFGAIQSAAPSLGLEVTPINVRDAGEIERAVATFARSGHGGLIVPRGGPTRSDHRACGSVQTASSLPYPRVRDRRWSDLVRS